MKKLTKLEKEQLAFYRLFIAKDLYKIARSTIWSLVASTLLLTIGITPYAMVNTFIYGLRALIYSICDNDNKQSIISSKNSLSWLFGGLVNNILEHFVPTFKVAKFIACGVVSILNIKELYQNTCELKEIYNTYLPIVKGNPQDIAINNFSELYTLYDNSACYSSKLRKEISNNNIELNDLLGKEVKYDKSDLQKLKKQYPNDINKYKKGVRDITKDIFNQEVEKINLIFKN